MNSLFQRTTTFLAWWFYIDLLSLVVVFEGGGLAATLSPHCELWNAALCKPTDQRSVYNIGSSEKGVDGVRNRYFYDGSCFHTNLGSNNWWMVDLMDAYLVHQVVVTNRGEGYSHRFRYMHIQLYTTDPRVSPGFPADNEGVQCRYETSSFVGTKSFDCPSPTYARYVKILKTNSGFINLCEIEVMVSAKQGELDCQNTVSKVFDIHRNSRLKYGHITDSTTTRTALQCTELCRTKFYHCNGCLWNPNTRLCQTLTVDPRRTNDVINSEGTDLYVESKIKCIGDGKWI